MTELQKRVALRVTLATCKGEWYRAADQGERVTLASLYRARVLERQVWRKGKCSRDDAHEYKACIELVRSMRNTIALRAGMKLCMVCGVPHGEPLTLPTDDPEEASRRVKAHVLHEAGKAGAEGLTMRELAHRIGIDRYDEPNADDVVRRS